jgi:hypothetical protein
LNKKWLEEDDLDDHMEKMIYRYATKGDYIRELARKIQQNSNVRLTGVDRSVLCCLETEEARDWRKHDFTE